MKKLILIAIFIMAQFLINCGPSQKGNSKTSNNEVLLAVLQGTDSTQTSINETDPKSLEVVEASPEEEKEFQDKIQEAFAELNDGSFTFSDKEYITSFDGTKIDGNIFVPSSASKDSKRPVVIFINSWALNEYEYLVPAAKLAKKGYIVFSYSTRGFGKSEGLINVAGPKDMKDLSAVIDYLELNYPIQKGNIGLSGISYGGGTSLLGLANEPRVRTAVAMSGWTDLAKSLHGNGSTRLVWGLLLLGSGYLTGNMDPIILEQYKKLLTNTEIESVYEWAGIRSPKSYIDLINEAGKPVYISSNLSDELFQPNGIIRDFQKLNVPKKLDLNQGIHASAELPGIIGLENYIWTNTFDWFDYHLNGIENGIMNGPIVTMEKKFSKERVKYFSWPAKEIGEEKLYTHPRGLFTRAGLKASPYSSYSRTNTIYSGLDTIATAGIPILSPILESHIDAPVYSFPNLVSTINGITYTSDTYSNGLKIRGVAQMELDLSISGGTGMTNIYLYDMSSNGSAVLITHGTASNYDKEGSFRANVDLVATAYDLPAGHKLSIVIDTFEAQYAVPTLKLYSVNIKYNKASPGFISIPVEN